MCALKVCFGFIWTFVTVGESTPLYFWSTRLKRLFPFTWILILTTMICKFSPRVCHSFSCFLWLHYSNAHLLDVNWNKNRCFLWFCSAPLALLVLEVVGRQSGLLSFLCVKGHRFKRVVGTGGSQTVYERWLCPLWHHQLVTLKYFAAAVLFYRATGEHIWREGEVFIHWESSHICFDNFLLKQSLWISDSVLALWGSVGTVVSLRPPVVIGGTAVFGILLPGGGWGVLWNNWIIFIAGK